MKSLINIDKELQSLDGTTFLLGDKVLEDGTREPIVATPRNLLVDLLGAYVQPESNDEAIHLYELAKEIRDTKEEVVQLRHADVQLIERILQKCTLPVALRGILLTEHFVEKEEDK